MAGAMCGQNPGGCSFISGGGKTGHVTKDTNKFLKACEVEQWVGKPIPVFYHKRTVEEEAADPESWLVEKILGHRVEANGRFFVRVKWQGSDEITWEPLGNFMHEYSIYMVRYCKGKGLLSTVMNELEDY